MKEISYWSNFIDFTSGGIFAAILGANSPLIHKALDEAPMISCYGGAYTNKTTERYKAMLKEFTGYESVALFSTGSEATEAFWRCCRVYNGKPGVWGGLVDPDEIGGQAPRCDAMHGWTLGALIMSGRITWPELGYSAELGRARFGMNPTATSCMIMEPYHAPSAQFHRDDDTTIGRIRMLQKDFPEIPLCLDEIQGGFGRTGKLFAHQWYISPPECSCGAKGESLERVQCGGPSQCDHGKMLWAYCMECGTDKLWKCCKCGTLSPGKQTLKPDFVTIGKGCGGGLPLSALLGPKEIMEDPRVVEEAHLGSTHAGNPVMSRVGIAVIEALQKFDLIEKSRIKGLYLAELLKDCGVRVHSGKGLLAGLEFSGPEEVKKVVDICYNKGLLVVDTGRKWVKIGPPFNISESDLEQGVKVLKFAIEEVLSARQSDVETCGNTGA